MVLKLGGEDHFVCDGWPVFRPEPRFATEKSLRQIYEFSFRYRNVCGIFRSGFAFFGGDVGKGGAGHFRQVLGTDAQLEAASPDADVDVGEVLSTCIDVSGQCLLHANGRTAATDVSRGGQQEF